MTTSQSPPERLPPLYAGNKRVRRTTGATRPAKRPRGPRYTSFPAARLPNPPTPVSALQAPPALSVPTLSSSASSPGELVLPATPIPAEQPCAPTEKRADKYNLLGSLHYTFVKTPENRWLPIEEEGAEKIVRPPWDPVAAREAKLSKKRSEGRKAEKTVAGKKVAGKKVAGKKAGKKVEKKAKKMRKVVKPIADGKSSNPAPFPKRVEADITIAPIDSEQDTEFEADGEAEDEAAASTVVVPCGCYSCGRYSRAVTSADVALEGTAPAAEEDAEDDGIVIDDYGLPVKRSV
jgi:hypothetical protein